MNFRKVVGWFLSGLMFATCIVVGADVVVPVVAPVVETSSWQGWLGTILQWVIGIVGTVLTILIVNGISLLTKKWGIELGEATKTVIENAAHKAVLLAEAKCDKMANKPTSNEKQNMAIEILKTFLHSDIITKYTDERLKPFIDAKVKELFNMSPVVPVTPVVTVPPTV